MADKIDVSKKKTVKPVGKKPTVEKPTENIVIGIPVAGPKTPGKKPTKATGKKEKTMNYKVRKNWSCEMCGVYFDLKKGDKVALTELQYEKFAGQEVI